MRTAHAFPVCSLIATTLFGAGASAYVTNTLDFADARVSVQSGGNITFGTVAGRTGAAIIQSSASIWGTAADDFGMPGSGNAGVGGWAGSNGALLSDITGVSFDWYRESGGLGGGFRVAMYVYSPTSVGDVSGVLQFDLMSLLPGQSGGEWTASGNILSGATGSAWYSADYGSSQFTGYKTWAEINSILSGWSVYEIGIINDAGYTASIDTFAVTIVPGPGAAALLALAGRTRSRRRR